MVPSNETENRVGGTGREVGKNSRPTLAPKRVQLPPEEYDRLKVFGGLVLCLLVCALPLMVGLFETDVSDRREAETLLRARETWQLAVDPDHSYFKPMLIPSLHREQSITQGPMTVWLHILSWRGLDSETTSAQVLAQRARGVSVAMGLLALLATYWAGLSLGGIKVGRLATLAMGTTLLFMYYVRWATPEPVLLGFTSLSVAAGLWAMRPLKDVNWVGRRVTGWVLAGVALAGAILTTGPTALGYVLPPLIVTIVMTSKRRASNIVGLIFAVTGGVIVSAPWYLYVIDHVPGAQEVFIEQMKLPNEFLVLSWSQFKLVVLLCPWIIWLIGAMCQPFMRADRKRRKQLLIAWYWFFILLVGMSSMIAEDPRHVLPLMPAVGLMVGQLWAYHAALASQRQLDPGVNLLRLPHWIILGAMSVLGPAFIALQPMLLDGPEELPGLDLSVVLALGCVLGLLAYLGTRWHFKWRPRLAAYATTAWMIVAATVGFYSYSGSHKMTNEHRADAERVAEVINGESVALLYVEGREDPLGETFVFYMGDRPENLDKLNDPENAVSFEFIIARNDPKLAEQVRKAGYESVFEFIDGRSRPRRLYRRSLGNK